MIPRLFLFATVLALAGISSGCSNSSSSRAARVVTWEDRFTPSGGLIPGQYPRAEAEPLREAMAPRFRAADGDHRN